MTPSMQELRAKLRRPTRRFESQQVLRSRSNIKKKKTKKLTGDRASGVDTRADRQHSTSWTAPTTLVDDEILRHHQRRRYPELKAQVGKQACGQMRRNNRVAQR